jgi:hypothetical protein
MWQNLYCVFTYIYSLLIEKTFCECQKYQLSFHVFICVFYLEISSFSWLEFPFFYSYFYNMHNMLYIL